MKWNRIICKLAFLSLFLLVFCPLIKRSMAEQYVVVGQPELYIQIEGHGDFSYKFVVVNDKRFGSAVPMITKITNGKISGLKVENHTIELIDGQVEDGFLQTKDFGKVRILGVGNPVHLWVTEEQKEKLMKFK